MQRKESKQRTQNATGSQSHNRENRANVAPNKERRYVNSKLTKVRTDLEEFKLISFNVRGLNSESKQKVVDELVRRNKPHMVCFSETKLQSAMYLAGFWSFQTMFQRNGGCWNASRTNTRHQLVKSLGTYMCWTQLQLGNTYVQVFNCYLHPGEQQNLRDRAKRVLDIVKDVIR